MAEQPRDQPPKGKGKGEPPRDQPPKGKGKGTLDGKGEPSFRKKKAASSVPEAPAYGDPAPPQHRIRDSDKWSLENSRALVDGVDLVRGAKTSHMREVVKIMFPHQHQITVKDCVDKWRNMVKDKPPETERRRICKTQPYIDLIKEAKLLKEKLDRESSSFGHRTAGDARTGDGLLKDPHDSWCVSGTSISNQVEQLDRNIEVYPLHAQLELSLSATNLFAGAMKSKKSRPMVAVFVNKGDGKMDELGRTEVISKRVSPAWIDKISVSYQFEMVQTLIFRVYFVGTEYHNVDVKALKLEDQDFLGQGSCALSEIVTKQTRSFTLNLQNGDGYGHVMLGTLTVRAEETMASKSVVVIKFRFSQLENKDGSSISDPVLRVSRIVESGCSVPICETEVVDNNLNPIWKPVSLSMQQFRSKDNPLLIECFGFNSNGDHVFIGKLEKSVAELEKLFRERSGVNFIIPSSHGHEKASKDQLFVDQYIEKQQSSFLDYISRGFKLDFMVAVDFTASNGDPHQVDSLHYIDPNGGRLNSYQQAIKEVGEVIQFYDADKRFSAWGFGGRIPGQPVEYCFNLSRNRTYNKVEGVQGILTAYASIVPHVTLSEPTQFSPVVTKAGAAAAGSQYSEDTEYHVLLIITNGVHTDLQETTDALVKASNVPLSVLIVGVGNADFKQLEILNADKGSRLTSLKGIPATRDTRDIVKFVPMKEVQRGSISVVVQSLLEKLPGQFLSYRRCREQASPYHQLI